MKNSDFNQLCIDAGFCDTLYKAPVADKDSKDNGRHPPKWMNDFEKGLWKRGKRLAKSLLIKGEK